MPVRPYADDRRVSKSRRAIGKSNREHQKYGTQDDRSQPGSSAEAILSLQAAGAVALTESFA
jgi:hypothetical protein